MRLRAAGNQIYDRKFEKLPARNVTIQSVFASFKYFQHVEKELRADLTFKPYIINKARVWLEQKKPRKWQNREFVRVLIHVRRTDFLRRPDYIKPTTDYFRQSVAYFTDCLERVQFVVLSDDLNWCRNNIKAKDIVFSKGHSPIEDLAIASLCDHAIITVGTYGWWAAWFANGVTVVHRRLKFANATSLIRPLPESIGV